MKWVFVVANVIAAVGFVILGDMAMAAHRMHAYSTYRELVVQGVLVERPDYNVAQHLQAIAAGGSYPQSLGWIGAAACLVNAVIIACSNLKPACTQKDDAIAPPKNSPSAY
jgi:hypothetical protein